MSIAECQLTEIDAYMSRLGAQARQAAASINRASTAQKNTALLAMADAIHSGREALLTANQQDLEAGERKHLASALMDRLQITHARIETMIEGLHQVAALPDPIGEITELKYRPSGIQVGRMRMPLGVIGIIYESRPNVTCEAASLCMKSGNATILRGGSEALNSNQAIARAINSGLVAAELDSHAVQVMDRIDREAVGRLITMNDFVDVIVPRGGKGLIERISAEASVPVIRHLDGNCHVYIDGKADLLKSVRVVENAKTQRYGTCCTMESLLVDEVIADEVLPQLAAMFRSHEVEMRGCPATRDVLPDIAAATERDWGEEYLAPVVSIRIVTGLEAAIEHINRYGSAHTDTIMTEDINRAQQFLREVDSSSVMVNASTRFADGYEYGLGAEIGISTDKLHARGPVGLEGLTSQKYIVLGDGHLRQ